MINNLLLANINISSVLTVIGIVAVISIVFAILIVTVSKLCFVKEDERVKSVSEQLAGANCGGCGYAGCSDFAKALAEGNANINDCGATPSENKEIIANILSIPYTASVQTMAVVKCAGGNKCKDKFDYVGLKDCTALLQIMGGKKSCQTACLGEGSCALVCSNNGISIVEQVALVDSSSCTSCGACVKKCPRQLIELIPKSAKVYVACSSHCKGKEVIDTCSVGCIGCGLCAKNCPQGAITMTDNLPVIDYEKCTGCKVCVSKCPKKTIKEI